MNASLNMCQECLGAGMGETQMDFTWQTSKKECEKIEQQVMYVIAMNYTEDVKKVKEKQSQFSQGVINLDPQL